MRKIGVIILFFFSLSAFSQTNIIPTGSNWKYNDSGYDLGTAWTASSYNDASWSSGNAVLGYGTMNAAAITTTLSYGADPNNKHITYYFRKSFNYNTTGSETYYQLSTLIDDGAVLYINGVEVERINMPTGTITYTTLASTTGNENSYDTYTIPASSIQNGTNVFAVEVHQVSSTSSDIGMDISLTAHFDFDIGFIHFGSTNTPLNGLSITWKDVNGVDSIKWGYTNSYLQGSFAATSRVNYSDSLYEYTFPNLTASQTIYYRIYSAYYNGWTDEKTFNTSTTTSNDHFTFTALGDSRTYLNDWQSISDLVYDSDFSLFMGDIVNNGGNSSEWTNWFNYGNNYLESNVVYHALGNHDANGGGTSNYINLFTLPTNPSGSELYYSFTFGNAIFICLDTEHPANSTQYNWLVSTLSANSDKKWKFVWFHKPFYTEPSHQTDMHSYWNTWWKAFDDYGVDLIFNGHTHNYQRTHPINRNVSTTAAVNNYGSCPESGRCQIVTGGAGAPTSGVGSNWFINNSSGDLHFCYIEVKGDTLEISAINSSLSTIDNFQIIKNFSLSTTSTNESPAGANNGSCTAHPLNGAPAYSYNWSSGDNTATASNLGVGKYYVTVTDDDLCTLNDSAEVIVSTMGVETNAATNVDLTTATLNGTINPTSGVIFGVEFEWGLTTSYGNIATASPNWANSTSSTTGSLTTLSSGTTYHYRTKGTDGGTTYYGADVSFTTTPTTAPVVNIGSAFTNITDNIAENTLNEVISDGGSAITERGIVYSISSNPTTSDNKKTVSGTTGVYDVTLTGLSHNTTFYAKAYAINSVGTSYSSFQKSFTTEPSQQAEIDSIVRDPSDPTSLIIYFEGGNGNGSLVVIKEGSSVNNHPEDGIGSTTYTANTVFGSGYNLGDGCYVVFNGQAKGSVTVTNTDESSDYYVEIVEYSGSGKTTNYRTGDAASGDTDDSALPIELLDFNLLYKNKNVIVNWTTVSETNNDVFEIERAINAVDFTIIKKVIGAGNSNEIIRYSAIDNEAVYGISYYRLKQIDYDGMFSYSPTLSINISKNNNLQISNLIINENIISFILHSNSSGQSIINLTNTNGSVMKSVKISDKGSSLVRISKNGLSKGVYFIRIQNNQGQLTKKIFI